MISFDAAYAASERRDAAYDGAFVLAVATTGIYCKPSCPARMPKRENVRLFTGGEKARAAGYRACKRCRPA
ncbi:MAG: Ada metal-binding domain-containing protein [Gemmatimonadaceae bacterium]